MYLNVMGQSMLVLNSQKAAGDLLERRAGIYSDRPRMIVLDYLTNLLHFSLTPHNDL